MRIAITGSRGRVARELIPGLGEHELVLLDAAAPAEGHAQVDILDLTALTTALRGVDAVVHLAARAAKDSAWEDLRGPNIDGVRNVLEAARGAEVERVVLASSSHVVGGYDLRNGPILATAAPRPDTVYGATKAFAEALGAVYAHAHGLRVVCLRIGWVRADPAAEAAVLGVDVARRIWLSRRDLHGVVRAALQADVRYGVYFAVSRNGEPWWDLEAGRRDLGWEPLDDATTAF